MCVQCTSTHTQWKKKEIFLFLLGPRQRKPRGDWITPPDSVSGFLSELFFKKAAPLKKKRWNFYFIIFTFSIIPFLPYRKVVVLSLWVALSLDQCQMTTWWITAAQLDTRPSSKNDENSRITYALVTFECWQKEKLCPIGVWFILSSLFSCIL